MYSHLHDGNGFGMGAHPNASSVIGDPNGDIVRRQVRANGIQQHNGLKVLPPPVSSSIPHPYYATPSHIFPKSNNGFPVHHPSPHELDASILRPISTALLDHHDQSNAMAAVQSFNASIAQRAGIQDRPISIQIANGNGIIGHHKDRAMGGGGEEPSAPIDETFELHRIYASVGGTLGIGIGASVMAILAFQLLLNLNYYESPTMSGIQLTEGSVPQILRDLAIGLTSLTLTSSMCAILSSFSHSYLCLRMIGHAKGTGWTKRVDAYRRRTLYIRALANGGFFVGVIVFLLALITYQQLLSTAFGTLISSAIVTSLLGAGAIFCAIALVLSFYHAGICEEIRPARAKISAQQGQNAEKLGTLF